MGTNPEELIAAAHSGCFTMQLSAFIGEAGFTPDTLETKCVIDFQNGAIVGSHLTVEGKIPGISNDVFQELVTKAEKNCPISKVLNTEIANLSVDRDTYKAKWQEEKELVEQIQNAKAAIEDLKVQAEQAERNGDYGQVAEIRYGKMKAQEELITELEKM